MFDYLVKVANVLIQIASQQRAKYCVKLRHMQKAGLLFFSREVPSLFIHQIRHL